MLNVLLACIGFRPYEVQDTMCLLISQRISTRRYFMSVKP